MVYPRTFWAERIGPSASAFAGTVAFLCGVVILCGAATAGESFYEREPADIFMGDEEELAIEAVSVSESGTVRAALSNGLVVLLKENHAAPVAIVQVTVKAGSIYEQEYLAAGISHLFEHLMSGGTTTTRTEEETAKILDSLGGMTNAYTSFDRTSYYIKVTVDPEETRQSDLNTAMALLSDWMMNTRVTQKEFDREMKVIQREYERTLTSPERTLFDLAGGNMFHVHPVRYPILGYPHVRARLVLEDAYRYRARMYVPNNMVFAAVGDFAWPDVLERIRSAFNGFRRGAVPAIALPEEPEQVGRRMIRRSIDNLHTTLITASYHTIMLTHPDLYPLDVLAGVLGQGESSRLVRIIKNERNLVQSISAWSYTPGYDAGRFTVYASVPDPNNVQPVIDAVGEQIQRFKTELVDTEELQRVKSMVAADHVYGSQTVESQASSLVMGYLSAGDPDFDQRYVAGIQEVTAEEVRRVANEYLSDDKLCITIVEPKGAEQAATAREQPPGTRVDSEGRLQVQKSRLNNGLTLLVKRNPNVPMVAFELYFLAGLRAETETANGISSFAAQLWGKGTRNRSPVELAAELDSMGASISTGSGNNTFFLRATCLSQDFEKVADIVSDLVLNASFDATECEKLRTRILDAIKQRDDSIYGQTERLLHEAFYGKGSPYAMDRHGTAETVGSFSPEELAKFYRTYARGPNGVLAVYGDIDPDAAQRILSRKLAALSAEPAPQIKSHPGPKLHEDKQVAAQRERKDAAAVYYAFPGISFSNIEDRYAMRMLDVVLSGGGHPGGWLHDALRGAGLVYEVHAFNIMGVDPRHFQIMAITNPAAVEQVKETILKQITKMRNGEIGEDEFRRAKKICIAEELMSRQTNSAQAMTAAIDELYGLGYDFDSKFAQRVDAVTIEDVVRVANKYLAHYVCAVVTPGEQEAAEQRGK